MVNGRWYGKEKTGKIQVKRSEMQKVLLALFLILVSFYSPFTNDHSRALAAEWKEEKGDHFIVYYGGDPAFAKEIKRSADLYYTRIAEDLGYARHSNFWQWDKRVKIYIYPTEAAFQQATGKPAWTKGLADYNAKTIITYAWSKGFTDALLPHEITHLIFRDFVGFKGEVPLWLDEGVAQWEEPKKREIARDVAVFLIKSGKNFPLEELTKMDVRESQDQEAIHYFYMQSVSLVDYLVKKHGPRQFTVFCRALRDGKSMDAALKAAFPNSLVSLKELEERWIQEVTKS